jgi:hypothetical protein
MRAMPASGRSLRVPIVLALAGAGMWLALVPAMIAGTALAASSPALGQSVSGAATGLSGASASPGLKPNASATLTQCATATMPQTERSVTFTGEMTAVPGSTRMEMRIDLEERAPGEALYRTVTAAALGGWHLSAPGVKAFTHIQQVTNLSAPAFYRGVMRFRWLGPKGRTIKVEELRTARCEQPAPPSTPPAGSSTTTAGAAQLSG